MTAGAAAAPAVAAARTKWQKQVALLRVKPTRYVFVPFSVESYMRHGQPVMELLHKLGDYAAGPGGVTRASLVAGDLWELSIGLCRGNFLMYCASVGMLARDSRTGFRAGMDLPTDEAVV
jgi:hypothetical protein